MSSNWIRGVAGVSALAVVLTALPTFAQKDDKKATFEVYQDAKKEWRWRFKAPNGAIIATPGEGYKDKASATKAIESLQKDADLLKVEYFEDSKKEHRWRLKAKNGEIIAVSSEGYKDKRGAENGFEILKKGAAFAKIVEAPAKDKDKDK
jgi:uncharacterized protein YegP (UPF0339 family)